MKRSTWIVVAACLPVICSILLWVHFQRDTSSPPADAVPALAIGQVLAKDASVTVSSSSPNPVALPPAGTPLSSVVRQLEVVASSGERKAACRLAQDIRRCNNIRNTVDAADIFSNLPLHGQEASLPEQLLKQAEGDAAFCAGVSPQLLERGYEFQARAADSGDREFERWLILAPDLDQQDFLADLERWGDYKKRAKRYIERALGARDGDDFQLLIALHAPPDFRSIRPPYRADDDATFLALMRVASKYGIQVPTQMGSSAQRISRTLSPEEKKNVDRQVSTLLNGWNFSSRQRLVDERFATYQQDAFCR